MKSCYTKKATIPKVLLIGSGRFGRNHIRVLQELFREGKIDFIGVVVRDAHKRKLVETEFSVNTFDSISPKLLKEIDAVDIVTPPETHFEIVRKCLQYGKYPFLQTLLSM